MRRRHPHNLSHYKLATFEMGKLIPIGLVEALPGDTFNLSTSALIRFSPLAAPVMHPVECRIHHFFVPHRIVWDGWEDFITGGPDGTNSDTVPRSSQSGAVTVGSLGDYYGIAPGTEVGGVSDLPIRGYNAIFNEYYRDQDLVDPIGQGYLNGPAGIAWQRDYFTASRPFTQKGPDVTVPIGGLAPVIPAGANATPTWSIGGQGGQIFGQQGASSPEVDWMSPPGATGQAEWENPSLEADLSNADAVSVNEFRRAFALQRYAEARARYGSRYTEYLRFLGVTPSDARLQRPEYIGGGKAPVSFSEVMQTAPEGTEPSRDYGVGDLYGHGISALRSRPVRRFMEEHGYIHSFASIRPRTMYVNSVPRHYWKETKEDFWQPELMQIGQQEVFTGEVYGPSATPLATFGYTDRYQEYKRSHSCVSGEFRSLLNYWHLGRDFEDEPALNATFVTCDPSKRIFNEQTQHPVWAMFQHRCRALRLVAKGGASRIL